MKPTLTLLTALLLPPLAVLQSADSGSTVPVRNVPTASWHMVQKTAVASAGSCIAEGNIVKLAWQENVAVECEIKPLVVNRLYTLEGRAFAPGTGVKLALVIKQFPGAYPVAEKPDTVTDLAVEASPDGSPVTIPFYLCMPNSRVRTRSGPAAPQRPCPSRQTLGQTRVFRTEAFRTLSQHSP